MKFEETYSFDDVLMVPQRSNVTSRSTVDLSVKLSKGIKLKNPIIPANMKSVCGKEMAALIASKGGMAILHRFMPIEEQLQIVKELFDIDKSYQFNIGISLGVKEEDKLNIKSFYDLGVKIVCIDVAHGHTQVVIDMCKFISEQYEDIFLIAGNVATGEAAVDLWKAGADAVKAGVGPGCFAAGTRILMNNGTYKNIEDVQPGDFVINKNGQPVKVLNAFSTGIRTISKLRTNTFYGDTYLTPDHKVWCGDLNTISTASITSYSNLLYKKGKTIPKVSKYKWKEVADLESDVLLFPKNINFNLPKTFSIELKKDIVKNNQHSVDITIIPSYQSGYLFGMFLGNGNSHTDSVHWSFDKNELDIANKLSDCINSIFHKSPTYKITNNMISVDFYHKPFAEFLQTFSKKLPDHLFVSNKEYLLGIYNGLLDSNNLNDGDNALSNTSKYIIELFNITSYMSFNILPNKPTSDNLKQSNIVNSKVKLTKNYQVVKKLEYTPLNMEVPVYDLTVDCPTHSFIANNMIVHNSLCSTRIETGHGVPQLSAIIDVVNKKKELNQVYSFKDRELFVIADGGIKSAGDCTKALAFADLVMCGSLFAGTDESPGEIMVVNGKRCKSYVGSSTHKTNHIEGIQSLSDCKGSADNVLTKLLEGITSGCSYSGAANLNQLKDKAKFVKITSAGLAESHPHHPGAIK